MRQRQTRLNTNLLLSCLLFSLLFVFLFRGITLPFVGHNAWNFNTYSLIARNYIDFGYLNTLFAPVVSVSITLPDSPLYYLHHPQLLSLVQSIFFLLLGDSHAVARLPVVLASFGAVYFFYKTADLLKEKKYAMSVLLVSLLVPGFSVFGRMIGQEALVLFFISYTTYFLLRFFATSRYLYLIHVVLGCIGGVFSDWPMVYFVVSLFPLFYSKERLRLYVALVGTVAVCSLGFLYYIYFILGSFDDIIQAFLVRSPGALLARDNWFFTWVATILFRVFLYFNPLVILFSTVGALLTMRYSGKNERLLGPLLLSFFIFGLWHILMYPEGSFGHAYWIIYLIPFVFFSGAYFLERLLKKKVIFMIVLVLAFFYSFVISEWKIDETEANLFRYYHAKAISQDIPPYSTVLINKESIIDPDLLSYEFKYDVKRIPENFSRDNAYAVYSCRIACQPDDISTLYKYYGTEQVRVLSVDGEVYLFTPGVETAKVSKIIRLSYKTETSRSLLRDIYGKIKNSLTLPQI